MQASVHTIEKSVKKTNEWLDELSENLGLEDKNATFRSMQAVLHVMRDRLPIDSAANLAAQLPLVVRGVFYENWDPSRTPEKIRDTSVFIDRVKSELRDDALEDRADEIIQGTFQLLNHRLNHDTIEKYRQAFPLELRELWPEDTTQH